MTCRHAWLSAVAIPILVAVVASCVGDEPTGRQSPSGSSGTSQPPTDASPMQPATDAGGSSGSVSDSGADDAGGLAVAVPCADRDPDTYVFCDDFEAPALAEWWTPTQSGGTLQRTDAGGDYGHVLEVLSAEQQAKTVEVFLTHSFGTGLIAPFQIEFDMFVHESPAAVQPPRIGLEGFHSLLGDSPLFAVGLRDQVRGGGERLVERAINPYLNFSPNQVEDMGEKKWVRVVYRNGLLNRELQVFTDSSVIHRVSEGVVGRLPKLSIGIMRSDAVGVWRVSYDNILVTRPN